MFRPKRCRRDFFDRHHLDVAEDLLFCHLGWDGVSGRIVETEAYALEGDPACHTATRPSTREFVRRYPPGTVYAYINYGMYWLLNVLAGDGIILIRAMEPLKGIETMQQRRRKSRLSDLCSGPGKLGQAINLGATDHGTSLMTKERHLVLCEESIDVCHWLRQCFPVNSTDIDRGTQAHPVVMQHSLTDNAPGCNTALPRDAEPSCRIVRDVRVGISSGLDLHWRFLIADNPHVSVPAGKALSKSRAVK
ncbi:MAG: DNA-3-methyladenine glycosylase [Planctomyces sp.]